MYNNPLGRSLSKPYYSTRSADGRHPEQYLH